MGNAAAARNGAFLPPLASVGQALAQVLLPSPSPSLSGVNKRVDMRLSVRSLVPHMPSHPPALSPAQLTDIGPWKYVVQFIAMFVIGWEWWLG